MAFSGTHGVGKTTAVKKLAESVKNMGLRVGVGHEVARFCPLPVNELGTGSAQIWIMMNQIANEAYLEGTGCQVAILDRCVFDHVAYAAWLHSKGKASLKEVKFLKDIAKYWAKTKPYTAIAILKAERPPEADGFRSTDRAYQLEVQDELFKVYGEVDFRDYRVALILKLEDVDFTVSLLQKYIAHHFGQPK